ncbi:amidohydrolase [Metabacillus arenae]|uniref:Amidohydrolase n=1 Tax=Metabacillus arenae TaxID=2771434 RepID=A0A926NG14_9BACI|nr:amidohydrolase [Metabacillus arenae]MBD1380130.1 amidohydrolase [Metabacillus arenae]
MGTLWHGGNIYTMIKENDRIDAIFSKNGKIIEVGKKSYLLSKYEQQINKSVDLKGSTLLPGLVDSHMHVIGHGEKLLRLDFSEMHKAEDILVAIQKRVPYLQQDEWIIGEGWNENQLENNRIIHKTELDEIAPNHPILLKRICRHAMIVNSKAMELAGITRETPDPTGGVIVRDHLGESTGYLLDKAQDLIYSITPSVSKAYLENALELSIEDCYKNGLVGVHTEDLSYYGDLMKTLQAFENVIQKKKFRAHLLVHHLVVDEFQGKSNSNTEFIEYGAMKIFADGALGGRTALLSKPYEDAPSTTGVAIHSEEILKDLIKKARDYNMEAAIHTIGDLAFENVLDAVEANPPKKGQHDRLIHAQILRQDLIERAKTLPIILDIQPRFVATDFPWVIERLGKERMKTCYPWKTLIEKGIHCAGGSDAPIEPINPLLGIHAAVTRKSIHTPDEPGYGLNECLTTFQAVELYTKGSAYAIHKEQERGVIAPGFVADFTVFNQDIFSIEDDKLMQTEVNLTVIDGEIVYKRENKMKKAALT